MSRFLFLFLITAILFWDQGLLTAQPDSLPRRACFSLGLSHADQEALTRKLSRHNFIATAYSLTKPHFHVGLACVHLQDDVAYYESLKRFIGEKIQRYVRLHEVLYQPLHVGRYLVGNNRTFHGSSLVSYPKESEHFDALNLLAQNALAEFNREHETNFKMQEDYLPGIYLAHMTMLGESEIAKAREQLGLSFDLQELKNNLIDRLSDMLQGFSFIHPVPNYNFLPP